MKDKKPLLIILVVLVVLALGGAYYVKKRNLSRYVAPQNPTASWVDFTSDACGFMLKHPQGWAVRPAYIEDKSAISAAPTYNLSCAYVTTPEYKEAEDKTREGVYVSITRTLKGSTYKGVVIKDSPDYVTASSLNVTSQPTMVDKSIGRRKGKYYTYKVGDIEMVGYLVAKGDYFYSITWPAKGVEVYQDDINLVLDSMKFGVNPAPVANP